MNYLRFIYQDKGFRVLNFVLVIFILIQITVEYFRGWESEWWTFLFFPAILLIAHIGRYIEYLKTT